MSEDTKPITTGTVARYCGVTRNGVIRWIRQGKLEAFRTPGGHYRIRKADFRAFLKKFGIPVDATFFEEKT
ncbi:MAG: helix-turn-helix domain-containing protein [Anaerolineae bacterium]